MPAAILAEGGSPSPSSALENKKQFGLNSKN